MRVSNFQKKGIITGCILILAGALVLGAGFGMAGFDAEKLQVPGEHKWYQTVSISEKGFWMGIRIMSGSGKYIYITSLGTLD